MSDHIDTLVSLRNDPVLFVETCLGAKPQTWQREALWALADRADLLAKHKGITQEKAEALLRDRISVASCNGAGKSTLLAWVVLWFLLTRYPTKVVCTAGTANQLSDVLWAEIAYWMKKLPEGFQQHVEWKSDKIELKGSKNSFAVARTSRREQPDALQGHHAENMLFIIDEASGVPDIVFEVGQGSMSTKGAKVIMTGNPLRRQGFFYDSHSKNRANWYNMRVSAFDCDYVTPSFIEDMASQYGEESAAYKARVLGQFPDADDDVLIPAHLIEAAMERDITPGPGVPILWGLDVARFGDDRSVLCKRQGGLMLEPLKVWRKMDLMELCGRVYAEYDACNFLTRPQEILVDSIGVGSGVVDRLDELGLPVRGVNVSESPSFADKYFKARDELWFRAREWFEARDCSMPRDDDLLRELTAPVYSFSSNGKLRVEQKGDTKKRLGYSPDLADAFVMTFASQVSAAKHGTVHRWNKKLEYPSTKWIA